MKWVLRARMQAKIISFITSECGTWKGGKEGRTRYPALHMHSLTNCEANGGTSRTVQSSAQFTAIRSCEDLCRFTEIVWYFIINYLVTVIGGKLLTRWKMRKARKLACNELNRNEFVVEKYNDQQKRRRELVLCSQLQITNLKFRNSFFRSSCNQSTKCSTISLET